MSNILSLHEERLKQQHEEIRNRCLNGSQWTISVPSVPRHQIINKWLSMPYCVACRHPFFDMCDEELTYCRNCKRSFVD